MASHSDCHGGRSLAQTSSSIRTLETSHPPTYYIPQTDIAMSLLTVTDRTSFCEWKGHTVYWTVAIAGSVFRDVGWSYLDPTRSFAMLRDHIAFYAVPFDQCLVDDGQVVHHRLLWRLDHARCCRSVQGNTGQQFLVIQRQCGNWTTTKQEKWAAALTSLTYKI